MRFKAPLYVMLLLLAIGIRAQVPDYTRQISRSFRISNAITVDISNKYGKVQVIPWNQDSVKFTIDLRIRAKDKAKLEKLRQNVDFEFTTGSYYVNARTSFGDNSTDVFKDLVDIAGSYLSTNNSVSINYTVMVPAWANLKIENKFGDVYLENLEGPLNLTLSYGDLKVNRLSGRAEIKLTSGDGEMGYIKDGQVILSYGNVHIGEAARLTAQTRSSNLTIDKVSDLRLDSRRDKIYLNDVFSMSGTSYFSAINITSLEHDLTLTGRYGDYTLNNIKRSFTSVNLASEYTDLVLSFEKPMAFNAELIHHQDVVLLYPKSIASLKTSVLDAENKLFTTSGTFGAGTRDSEVAIKVSRKCNVSISQK
jgi:hypothetical protein